MTTSNFEFYSSSENKIRLFQNKDFWLVVSLLLGFYLLYCIVGASLLKYAVTDSATFDFFGADQWEWADLDWTNDHKGSHPLLLIFLYPFKSLNLLSGWIPKPTLALLINALFGGLGVAGAYLVLKLYLSDRYAAILVSLIFGFSMSQLLFSSLLESYSLGGLTIIINLGAFMVGIWRETIKPIHWFLAGLLTFGVTITNFSHTVISFLVLTLRYVPEKAIRLTIKLAGAVLLTALCLAILQELTIDGEFFVKPKTIEREIQYISKTILNAPLFTVRELFKHFFLVNFVSPSPFPENFSEPITATENTKIILSYVGRPLRYSLWGILGVGLWLTLAVRGLLSNITFLISKQNKLAKPHRFTALAGILGITLFNLLLFSIFNTSEMFLFSCLYTFPVLLLVMSNDLVQWKLFRPVAILLVISMAVNNLSIIQEIGRF
jgi:hypothetical protein